MQFEHRVKRLPLSYSGDMEDDAVTDILNGIGASGWELVSVIQDPDRKTHGLFYFKKKIK
tara:strand:- start:79 stop:258 length:180 start_codon:yes stop_codon:yes gene_type:complete